MSFRTLTAVALTLALATPFPARATSVLAGPGRWAVWPAFNAKEVPPDALLWLDDSGLKSPAGADLAKAEAFLRTLPVVVRLKGGAELRWSLRSGLATTAGNVWGLAPEKPWEPGLDYELQVGRSRVLGFRAGSAGCTPPSSPVISHDGQYSGADFYFSWAGDSFGVETQGGLVLADLGAAASPEPTRVSEVAVGPRKVTIQVGESPTGAANWAAAPGTTLPVRFGIMNGCGQFSGWSPTLTATAPVEREQSIQERLTQLIIRAFFGGLAALAIFIAVMVTRRPRQPRA